MAAIFPVVSLLTMALPLRTCQRNCRADQKTLRPEDHPAVHDDVVSRRRIRTIQLHVRKRPTLRLGSAILAGMELDPHICYRALRSRDARFDGRFFTGVKSTGIYCRPICPARTPLAKNVVFFTCAAAAEEAGFRACQRCRPETAPGTPAWRGSSVTVSRAVRLIQEGAMDDAGVVGLAARLGVGDRHLRRLFAQQLGASPLALAHTRRVHYAKQMIEETQLSMTEIALAAGFANARRFNAAVRASFDRTPTEIRRRAGGNGATKVGGAVTLRLSYRVPFDWDGLLAFLSSRAIPGVERVEGRSYLRSVELDDFAGVISIRPDPKAKSALQLSVPVVAAPHLARIAARVRLLFDLDADPEAITSALSAEPRLRVLARRYPGTRVPGAWDPFELAVRAVLGQQITVAGATRLAGRIVERFGRPLPGETGQDGGPHLLFPRPCELGDAAVAGIGMPAARAETIRGIARTVAAGEPVLTASASLDEAVERLMALPGFGAWTAQYIAMRALREPDAFPAGDLGLRQALADGNSLPTAMQVGKLAEAWRPWRAYAAMLLWRSLA